MRFARPEILWLLLLLPAVAAAFVFAAARRRKALERFAGGAGQRPRFLGEVSSHRPAAKASFLLLALAAGITAAARPQWGTRLEPVTRKGVDVVVLLDTSLSMAAQDAPPDRLGLAKRAAASLVARLGGYRAALVTFSGKAVLVCPLTLGLGAGRKAGEKPRQEKLRISQCQHQEPPEQEEMINAEFLAYHPHLGKCIHQHALEPRPEKVKPVLKASQADYGKKAIDIP